MCLIIFTPDIKHCHIRRSVLERGFYKNSDGAGLSYVLDGVIRISKPHDTFDSFIKAYDDIRAKIKKGPLLIHFRVGTCGPNTPVNTQPLVINVGSLVMAHNGIFSGLSKKDSEVSDSVELARLIRRMKWTHPFTRAEADFLTALCDSYSKLVFMDKMGAYTIINERLGAWRAGSWYSDKARILDKASHWSYRPKTRRGTNDYTNDDKDEPLFSGLDARDLSDEEIEAEFYALSNQHLNERLDGTVVNQAGIIVKATKIQMPERYEHMTKEQKDAFEDHRSKMIAEAANKRRSLPTHPFAGFKTHSMIDNDGYSPRNDFGVGGGR